MSPKNPEARMPWMSHLGELRNRLRNSSIVLLVTFAIAYPFRNHVTVWVFKPLIHAFENAKKTGMVCNLVFISPTEAFMVLIKTALVAALVAASPFVFYQLWRFVAPGLYPKERRWSLGLAISTGLLFVGGSLFCYYFVLPAAYDFFLSAGQGAEKVFQSMLQGSALQHEPLLKPQISMDEYFGTTLLLLLVFGLVFELPLLLCVLAILGMVSAKSLWKFNRYAVVIFVILGAILTPGDLVVGQLMMAGSLTVLYNISIGLALLFQRKRIKAQTA